MTAFEAAVEALTDAESMKASQAQELLWDVEAETLGAGRAGFFQPRATYFHPGEGTFAVAFVDAAPDGFGHHSETDGVAFGWRVGVGGEPLGSYSTPDFAGWTPTRAGGQ